MIDPVVQAAAISSGGLVVVAVLQVRGQRLQAKIKHKVDETHHQVTTNSHASAEPTVLDRMEDLKSMVERVEGKIDKHLEWHGE